MLTYLVHVLQVSICQIEPFESMGSDIGDIAGEGDGPHVHACKGAALVVVHRSGTGDDEIAGIVQGPIRAASAFP